MMYISEGLYVRIQELNKGPTPYPLASGFSIDRAYRVLGGFTMSESAEMYFLLTNDRMEPWFISNRHCRVQGVHPTESSLSYSLSLPER